MRTIAVVNQKGGSGKTTTTVNLAAALAEKNRKVLVIDIDAQRSTTDWLGDFNGHKGIYSVIVENGNIGNNILPTVVEGVDIIPASTFLIRSDKALSGEVGAESILKHKLAKIEGYDYALIDCPPQLGILTINALCAATELLVPVETNILALKGMAQLLETLEKVKERLNPNLEITGVLACRVDLRTNHAKEAIETLRKRFGKKVFKTLIRQNIRLTEAPSFRLPITVYDPQCSGAQAYRSLAKEVIAQEA